MCSSSGSVILLNCLSGNSWTYSGLNKFNMNSLLMHVPALGFLVAIAKPQVFLLCTLSCGLSLMVFKLLLPSHRPLSLLPPLFAHFFFYHLLTNHLHHVSKVQLIYQSSTVVVLIYVMPGSSSLERCVGRASRTLLYLLTGGFFFYTHTHTSCSSTMILGIKYYCCQLPPDF